ncbi:MAG: DNRLRE domain-containing protein [Planctomycetes bacterium]|nr:DNRLRE domain-containing protein [Planctomycetota bacterium]
MIQSLRTWLVSFLLVPLSAQTVTVTLTPSRDATLYEDPNGALANGGGQYVFVGQNSAGLRRRTLVAFDIASVVPDKARIVFAELTMAITRTSATAPMDLDIHPVLADWGEGATVAGGGEGGGGPAQNGDATWLHRAFPATPWNTAGGDFGPISGRFPAPTTGNVVFATTTSLIGDVQSWRDHPNLNFGWLIKSDENLVNSARRIDSRENGTVANRPLLRVTYLPPGSALSVGLGCMTSAGTPFVNTVQGQVVRGQIGAMIWNGGIPGGLIAPLLSEGISPSPIDVAPGCTFWLRLGNFPSLGFRVLDQHGDYAEAFQVPPGAALFGGTFAMQTVMIDFAQPLGFALSNAYMVCIG